MRKSLIGQAVASLCLLLLAEPHGGIAEDPTSYAERLCREAGVPLEECTLLPTERGVSSGGDTAVTPEALGAGTGNRTKTETLAEHGRDLCAKQGVDLEDCLALPVELRTAVQAPETIAPSYNQPANSAHEQNFFRAQPPMRTRQVMRAPSPPAYKYAAPPSGPVLPAYVAVPYAPRLDNRERGVSQLRQPMDQYALPPTERRRAIRRYRAPTYERYVPPPRQYRDTGRYLRPRDDRNMPPAYMPPKRVRTSPEPYFRERERTRYRDRFDDSVVSGRCLRSVRHSAPPSYRYVACN